jgi:hypothetical protein
MRQLDKLKLVTLLGCDIPCEGKYALTFFVDGNRLAILHEPEDYKFCSEVSFINLNDISFVMAGERNESESYPEYKYEFCIKYYDRDDDISTFAFNYDTPEELQDLAHDLTHATLVSSCTGS